MNKKTTSFNCILYVWVSICMRERERGRERGERERGGREKDIGNMCDMCIY